MSDFSTQIFLIDSTVNTDQFLKSNNDSKIITFDNTIHHLLLHNKIGHQVSDQYVSRSDLDDILKHSMIYARWYLLPEIKEILSFKDINLGELFYIEFQEFLISFLKRFLEIKRIFTKFPNSKFLVSHSLFPIISSLSANVELVGNVKEQLSIYNKIDVPVKIGGKQLTLTLNTSNVQKIQKILEKLSQGLIKKNQFKPNCNNVLLIDFTTIKYKSLLQSIPNFQLNVIKYDRRTSAVWNIESYSIIKQSHCMLENYSTLNDKSMDLRITQNQDFCNKIIDQIMMKEQLLSSFFSFDNQSFWSGIKTEFVNICEKRFLDASKEFELAEKILKKYQFSAVLIWSETGLLEQIMISLAKKLKIPIILLQHGLYSDSPELITKNKFYGVIPKTSDIILVWGPKFKEYLVENGLDKNKISEIGSTFFDPIFNNMIKPAIFQDSILLATDPYAFMYPHELTTEFMETYESMIKKVYEIASKQNKRLVIKTHPQKSTNEEEIAKQIDPTITVIKSGDIRPLIKSSSLVIVTDMSTVILEAQAMKKPVISVFLRDYYGTPEPFKSNLCQRININDLDEWVTNVINSNDFQNQVILKGTEFVDSYLVNQGTSSESLLKFLESMNNKA
ncbi:UDP-N-acetylglucosamine 2-epimerase [Nitrosarchaeum koreense]|uniref:Epimerase 2 domain containing protein n=1 Tax=Nitrosarchaeum koreense MY1 TaxID=1001994 RepID=F9CYA3_9ARCH|nr:UDP-N-acetylglucosamine 2-epimerase [Nitrosarchaeum koreense]EGP92881.1 Epimerase 2 domain containing protein [Nitrosarchaeum koreense MY1]